MNKIIESTDGLTRLLELLGIECRLQENSDSLLYYAKGIVEKGKELLAPEDAWSLIYLFDLCKKGHYEHLKVRRETAKGYFTRAISYVNTITGPEKPVLLHKLLGGLFISHHYSSLGETELSAAYIRESPSDCDKLYAISPDPFFRRLNVFMWLSCQKLLIKQGESAFAMNQMTDTLCGLLSKKGSSPEIIDEADSDYNIVSVFNVLYSFSLLTPSFKKYFRTAVTKAASDNNSVSDQVNFLAHFIKAQKAIAGGDITLLTEETGNMLMQCKESRQLYMLASVINELYTSLQQLKDDRCAELRALFQKFIKTEMPAYLRNGVFDVTIINNESLALSN